MNSLITIQKNFTTNAGGLKEINMAECENISSIRLPVGNVVSKGIKMNGSATFKRHYFTPDSCNFSQSFTKTAHGKEFTAKVSFSYPGSDPDVLFQFERMARMDFIIIPKDNNQLYRIIGSLDSPAKFSYEYDSNSDLKGASRYTCTFTAKASHSAYYYTGSFNKVVYNAGYNFGFLRTAQ